MTNHTRYIIDR